MEILYRHLTQGKVNDTVDYLINHKIACAEQLHISTKINIEFPRHTNIRSADVTAILGNLLDNALEAAKQVREEERFFLN